jgi:transcriptional regulator with XRE-family HTH domain
LIKDIIIYYCTRRKAFDKSGSYAIFTGANFTIEASIMQPEQMRAARAALNWSLERLAAESGVHRNTLSNFETRKFAGEPEKVSAVKHTLQSAGVIFIDENGEAAGIRLRRFRVGDRVKFRPETRVRFSFGIEADEIGTIVAVEPHPPQTGPTYRVCTQFGQSEALPFVFKFEYELVHPAIASLKEFVETSGRSMIPNGHFVARPALNVEPELENALAKLPTELGSLIIIPTADDKLKRDVEARGFFPQEANATLILMWRQFPDGALRTSL